MPPSAHDLGAEGAELIACEGGRSVLPHVLDLPGLLVHEMGASQTEVHLWVVAQMNHPVGDIDGAAAPALGAPILLFVDRGDGFGAHVPSLRARVTSRKCRQGTPLHGHHRVDVLHIDSLSTQVPHEVN